MFTYPPGDSSSPDLVKVVTAVEGATVFIYFTHEIGPWPFRIENDSTSNPGKRNPVSHSTGMLHVWHTIAR